MLPTNETLVATRQVIDEQIDKRMDELEREKYWDWQPTEDSSGNDMFFFIFHSFYSFLFIKRTFKNHIFCM